jgi:hypothetical protein
VDKKGEDDTVVYFRLSLRLCEYLMGGNLCPVRAKVKMPREDVIKGPFSYPILTPQGLWGIPDEIAKVSIYICINFTAASYFQLLWFFSAHF